MERIAHLSPYADETDLEALRLDDGTIELHVRDESGAQRTRLEPGDRILIESEWDLFANMAGAESRVSLLRGADTTLLAQFHFHMSWGGWQDEQIATELRKLGFPVEVRPVIRDHRK